MVLPTRHKATIESVIEILKDLPRYMPPGPNQEVTNRGPGPLELGIVCARPVSA